jgi:hypothetical protein
MAALERHHLSQVQALHTLAVAVVDYFWNSKARAVWWWRYWWKMGQRQTAQWFYQPWRWWRWNGKGTGTAAVNAGNGGSGIVIISYTSATQLFGGGTVTQSGGNFIHTFTSSGALSPLSSVTASYLVVAGGGGGGLNLGAGGGGAGGLLTGSGLT